jgi:transposase
VAKSIRSAHVVTIRKHVNGRVYETHLLRRSYRDGKNVRNQTLGNLTHLAPETIELIRRALRGEQLVPLEEAFRIERSRPHGHVAAVLGMARALEFDRLIDRRPSRRRQLALALIYQRVLEADSKLAMSRTIGDSTLLEELGIEEVDEDGFYAALDYLIERQGAIEGRLARRHLRDGTLVLYDLSSSYFEGRRCPLAARGYSRDRRRGSLQIVYGLLCDRFGRPVAVEVFGGNTVDHQTVRAQIEKLVKRFELERIVLVSDRGMVTDANLGALRAAKIDWITALKAPQVKHLSATKQLPLSLFDERNIAEIESPDYPGERLVVCRNPLVAAERARKREDLLRATEAKLQPIRERVERGTLRGKAVIGLAVGAVRNTYKMSKHLEIEIEDDRFAFERKAEQIAAEAALDGIYILRTTVDVQRLQTADVVRSYKQLAVVERAFRNLKSVDLEVRPIYHHLERRVRAHVFVCMLAYYLQWHLRKVWASLLFEDDDRQTMDDPVAKAVRSAAAQRKARLKTTPEGYAVSSFRTLLDHLATFVRCTVSIAGTSGTCHQLPQPTPLQARALELARSLPQIA